MLKEGKDRTFKPNSKLAKLDALITPGVFPQEISEAQLRELGMASGNGQGTTRQDGSFAKKYNYEMLRSEGRGNTVTGLKILGYAIAPESRSTIPKEVRDALRGKPCAFLGLNAGGMEIDHKDGWSCQGKDINDFQNACKSANVSKRNYCTNLCKPNGNRFDARVMGFNNGWIEGGPIRNQQIGCRGCYLSDPIAFRKACKIKN